MKVVKVIGLVLLISFGVFMIVYGEQDDSPGGQGLGLLSAAFGVWRLIKGKYFKTLIGTGLVLIVLVGSFVVSKSRTFQFFGEIIPRVDANEKIVALTFDDAPSEYVTEVLNILKEKNVKATFYAVGENLEKYPEEAKAIIASGNELGNHSYSHQRMVLKTPGYVAQEIEKTNELIRAAGYKEEITFRPPNGKKFLVLPWYLRKHDIKTIMWDVEPDTYYSGDTHKIIDYTINKVQPGSIILIHPLCATACAADREALPIIIDKLVVEGYRFVTIGEMLVH